LSVAGALIREVDREGPGLLRVVARYRCERLVPEADCLDFPPLHQQRRCQTAQVGGRLRSCAAGAAAAIVWALQEPLDQKLLRCDYSDVALLGKAVTRGGRGWRPAGLAFHTLNGALFGLAFQEARGVLPTDPRKLALGMAIAEHIVVYPLCYFDDRYHPARGETGIPRLLTNPRAFAQATWRHALFGAVLGRLA
jgi:hypothetical protein